MDKTENDMPSDKMTRRRFLGLTGGALAVLLIGGPAVPAAKKDKSLEARSGLASDARGERRILVLGGGGTTALRLQVEALIGLYGADVKGHELLAKMDHPEVWCTSAGAIMGVGLASDYSLRDIRSMVMSEDFLQGIYAARNKSIPQDKSYRDDYFVDEPGAGAASVGGALKKITRDCIVAAYEHVLGPAYSTESKTGLSRWRCIQCALVKKRENCRAGELCRRNSRRCRSFRRK